MRELIDRLDDNEIVIASTLGSISGKLMNYRDINDWTIWEMAEKLDISKSMMVKFESGEYDFTISQLINICDKLYWRFEILMNGDGML